MHWRHVSITTTPCWGSSRLVALRAHVLLAERIGAHPLSHCAHPGQLGGEACQGFALWLHAWRWCTWRASFDPQHHGGALLWRHMHMVYWEGVVVNAKIVIYILICETVNCAFKIQLVNLQQAWFSSIGRCHITQNGIQWPICGFCGVCKQRVGAGLYLF